MPLEFRPLASHFKCAPVLRACAIALVSARLAGAPIAPVPMTAATSAADLSLTADLETFTIIGKSEKLWSQNQALDRRRSQNLLPQLGATAYSLGTRALQAQPQGPNSSLDKVLLQAPGVSADSAVSNPDFHVRNEYANVQYRIDGIQLPDGVSALGSVLETGMVQSLDLLDGALPAQYGLRTAGVVDITTKTLAQDSGSLAVQLLSGRLCRPVVIAGQKERQGVPSGQRLFGSKVGQENVDSVRQ